MPETNEKPDTEAAVAATGTKSVTLTNIAKGPRGSQTEADGEFMLEPRQSITIKATEAEIETLKGFDEWFRVRVGR